MSAEVAEKHTAGPNQIRGIAARLCWEHPGYGDFITKKDASDALFQYAEEMEADTVRQAAPELLKAAKVMLEFYDEYIAAPCFNEADIQNPLRDAIAKAEATDV